MDVDRSAASGSVIVIDGPAGSGKSSTARAVAHRLGYRHLDSGALYRALTFALLDDNIPPDSWPALTVTDLERHSVRLVASGAAFTVKLGSRALTRELRTPEVDRHVSMAARLPAVRAWLLGRQRRATAQGPLVADGRDLGTVVFPGAEVKIFLTASLAERARRRLHQMDPGARTGPEAVAEEAYRLGARDRLDAAREIAPLRKAPDAVEIDGTALAFDEQVDAVLTVVHTRCRPPNAAAPAAPGKRRE